MRLLLLLFVLFLPSFNVSALFNLDVFFTLIDWWSSVNDWVIHQLDLLAAVEAATTYCTSHNWPQLITAIWVWNYYLCPILTFHIQNDALAYGRRNAIRCYNNKNTARQRERKQKKIDMCEVRNSWMKMWEFCAMVNMRLRFDIIVFHSNFILTDTWNMM